MASQAGPMRLAAWEALRSQSHRMGGGQEGEAGPQAAAAVGSGWRPFRAGGSTHNKGVPDLTLHIYLSASLNDRRHRHTQYPLFKVLRAGSAGVIRGDWRCQEDRLRNPTPAPSTSSVWSWDRQPLPSTLVTESSSCSEVMPVEPGGRGPRCHLVPSSPTVLSGAAGPESSGANAALTPTQLRLDVKNRCITRQKHQRRKKPDSGCPAGGRRLSADWVQGREREGLLCYSLPRAPAQSGPHVLGPQPGSGASHRHSAHCRLEMLYSPQLSP